MASAPRRASRHSGRTAGLSDALSVPRSPRGPPSVPAEGMGVLTNLFQVTALPIFFGGDFHRSGPATESIRPVPPGPQPQALRLSLRRTNFSPPGLGTL